MIAVADPKSIEGPYNADAEFAVLGILLCTDGPILGIEDLKAEHFCEPAHKRIYALATAIRNQHGFADIASVHNGLQGYPGYEGMGSIGFLSELMSRAPPLFAAPALAATIIDAALRRDVIGIARMMIEGAALFEQDRDAHDILAAAESDIAALARGAAPADLNMLDARSAVDEALAEIEQEAEHGKPKGLMTGLRCFDRRLRGLKPGHLIVLAGRPSMGKTALARQAAYGCANRNPSRTVAFFCLEMDRRELTDRALSEISYRDGEGLAYQDMTGDKLSPLDRMRLRELRFRAPDNLILADSAVLSVEHVRRRVWALKRKGNLAVVFIDYLQIMQRPDARGRNDAAVIGEMTGSLKRLAREAQIAIVLLSQINRGVESRDDKRPQIHDLKESGSIEQDANSVLFVYREAYYIERAEPNDGPHGPLYKKWAQDVELVRRRLDVICPKNRGGAAGTDRQEYYAEYDAISDLREER